MLLYLYLYSWNSAERSRMMQQVASDWWNAWKSHSYTPLVRTRSVRDSYGFFLSSKNDERRWRDTDSRMNYDHHQPSSWKVWARKKKKCVCGQVVNWLMVKAMFFWGKNKDLLNPEQLAIIKVLCIRLFYVCYRTSTFLKIDGLTFRQN